MEKLWKLSNNSDPKIINTLGRELNVSNIIAELLVKRNIHTFLEAKKFFRPKLEDLIDPFLMKGMYEATNKINESLKNGEKIMIYGDYDVDGTTSVALLYSYLTKQNSNAIYYIPDRYKEGYGLSIAGIEKAKEEKVSLIIIIDCGIKAIDQIELANSYQIDTIICDHHKPGKILPKAKAILNPKQIDCNYPYKELCGCGIGFKLIQAIELQKNQKLDSILEYLDLVAIAICADIVPITGENRLLTFLGLQLINKNLRPGFSRFLKNKKKNINVSDLIFTIAPRINAAGRMNHGKHAVELLICKEENDISSKARAIELLNTERKLLDEKITKEAIEQVETLSELNNSTTVVFRPDWHKGVIGIVASRLIDHYYRPTVVLTKSGDVYAGSVRSVRGFDVYEALLACSESMIQFGGHKYAAGLTLLEANYGKFKAQFEKVVSETIDPKLLIPEISIDSQLNLTDITPKFYRIISQFAPFGPGNMTPVFMTEDMQDTGYGKQVGEDKTHLRLTATQNGKGKLVGIGFGLGDQTELIKNKKTFKAAYTIDENEWNGNVSLQLKLKDIKP